MPIFLFIIGAAIVLGWIIAIVGGLVLHWRNTRDWGKFK